MGGYWETKPQTSAEDITSQTPSEPITINLSPLTSSICWISGSEINPIFFACKSPKVLVIAMPGPSSSAHTRYGPEGLKIAIRQAETSKATTLHRGQLFRFCRLTSEYGPFHRVWWVCGHRTILLLAFPSWSPCIVRPWQGLFIFIVSYLWQKVPWIS